MLLAAGLGFYLDKSKWWRIETGYMFQSAWNSVETSDERRRINHTFRVTLVSEMPFSRRKSARRPRSSSRS